MLPNVDTYDAAVEELYSQEEDSFEEEPLLDDLPSPITTPNILSTSKLFFLSFYSIGFGALWTFLLVVALPKEVVKLNGVGDAHKGTALGVVMLAGGVVSAIEPPLVGWLSDRTRTKWGRRKPYIFIGALGVVVAMIFLPYCTTVFSFTTVYVFVQLFSNLSSSANLGLMPDLVPQVQLGRASGMMGALGALGQLIGATSGVLVSRYGISTVYWILSCIYLICMLVTVCCIDEPESSKTWKNSAEKVSKLTNDSKGTSGSIQIQSGRNQRRCGGKEHGCLHTFTDALLNNYDFRWVFITRLLYNMGIYSVQEFLQYYVADVIPMKGWSTTSEVSLLFAPLLLGAFVSAYFGGKISDSMGGRRKIFIYISGSVQVVVCLLLAVNNSVLFAGILALFFGFASGCYAAVDFAMVLDVLPNSKNVARDLGVWHVSLVLPQLLSTPLSGRILDVVRKEISIRAGYSAIFVLSGFWFFISTVLVRRIKGVK